jgi:hypothetical protein
MSVLAVLTTACPGYDRAPGSAHFHNQSSETVRVVSEVSGAGTRERFPATEPGQTTESRMVVARCWDAGELEIRTADGRLLDTRDLRTEPLCRDDVWEWPGDARDPHTPPRQDP